MKSMYLKRLLSWNMFSVHKVRVLIEDCVNMLYFISRQNELYSFHSPNVTSPVGYRENHMYTTEH
jgi:hypothetical protein